MALANVAVLLARRGLRVLAVDWDLEAPGLERYFSYFPVEPVGPGLLRMFVDAAAGAEPDYKDYIWEVNCDAEHPLSFLPSGRDQDSDYSDNLERFDWADFFRKRDGGRFVEELRTRWREDFDIVLIDSRTGLSDTGGLCTIQLPDVVVAMFTANYQSLYGVRDVMRLAQRARQALAYDRMPLTVLPLPARFGTRAEFSEAQDWLGRFEEALQEFFDDWLPRTMRAKQVLERIKVPQVDFFAFGEKLAVVEQGTNDPEGIGFVYDKVSTLLATNFSGLEEVVGRDVMREQEAEEKLVGPVGTSAKSAADDYKYDLFVSYQHSALMGEYVQTITEGLRNELYLFLAEVRIYTDIHELKGGQFFTESLHDALRHSKLLLALVTPAYFAQKYCMSELLSFERRSELTQAQLVLPVLLRPIKHTPHSDVINKYNYLDLSSFTDRGKRYAHTIEFRKRIRDLATRTVELLEKAPPFDTSFPVVSPEEVPVPTLISLPPFPVRSL